MYNVSNIAKQIFQSLHLADGNPFLPSKRSGGAVHGCLGYPMDFGPRCPRNINGLWFIGTEHTQIK